MKWNTAKKARTMSLNANDVELENAERETVAAPPEDSAKQPPTSYEETTGGPAVERPGLFSRLFGAKPKQVEVFVIQPRWARGAVKACFIPLAKYQHPAWALTDEEAETVTPEMQTLLQATFDRYVPNVLNTWAARHTEIANLIIGLGSLYYMKYQAVNQVMLAEEAERKVIDIDRKPDDVSVEGAEPVDVKMIPALCGLCHVEFESREKYNAHLPCHPQRVTN